MIDVRRLGHATLETPDLARQIEYWTVVMGLRLVHQDKDRAFLATKLGQEALALERGSQSSLRRVSFQLAPGTDLREIEHALAEHEIDAQRRNDISPGIRNAVVFRDPKGTLVELFESSSFFERDRSDTGIATLKIGHVAYRVEDVAK